MTALGLPVYPNSPNTRLLTISLGISTAQLQRKETVRIFLCGRIYATGFRTTHLCAFLMRQLDRRFSKLKSLIRVVVVVGRAKRL